MKHNIIYRGYSIISQDGIKWQIYKDGKLLTTGLGSEEAMYQWIDSHRKVNQS